jgi:hypothetical protein
VVALIAAAPNARVDDLIRQGNAAVARKDYADAIKHFEQAEPRALDPGLVAYNKGVALYKQAMSPHQARSDRVEQFRKAEIAYRCAAEGAEDIRRVRAKFGLGNSLVQGRADEVDALLEAIACYRECLESNLFDEMTTLDVRHNLELAKLLLVQARTKSRDPDRTPKKDDGGDGKKKPEDKPGDKQGDRQEPKDDGKDVKRDGDKTEKIDDKGAVKDSKKPTETKKTEAGKGPQNTIFDPTVEKPLTPDAAEKELESAAMAIEKALREKRIRVSSLPNGSVKDW